MLSLKSKLPEEYSIWALGHGGHDIPKDYPDYPKVSENPTLFNLEGTIQQKIDFVSQNISRDQELILVGHSIGAKMVLETMRANCANVKLACLLFPTFENMITSPAGKRLKYSVKYLPMICQMILAWILSFLPQSLLKSLIRLWIGSSSPDGCVDASVDLINPEVIRHILFLADTELQTVLDPDYELLNQVKDKLWLYYGSNDPWVPLEYHKNLVENVPGIHAEVCKHDIPHAFVLNQSCLVAEIVSKRILDLE